MLWVNCSFSDAWNYHQEKCCITPNPNMASTFVLIAERISAKKMAHMALQVYGPSRHCMEGEAVLIL